VGSEFEFPKKKLRVRLKKGNERRGSQHANQFLSVELKNENFKARMSGGGREEIMQSNTPLIVKTSIGGPFEKFSFQPNLENLEDEYLRQNSEQAEQPLKHQYYRKLMQWSRDNSPLLLQQNTNTPL
jgi:hypothetical protein